jgi:putative proteasome-type protease
MTYCVAMSVRDGLVFLSDSRTNAGVDQISTFRKMTVYEQAGERVLVLMTAGNLALTQEVIQLVSEPVSTDRESLWTVNTIFEAARLIGEAVREVHQAHGRALQDFNVEFNCSFILGGQIRGQQPRLYQIYSAGNFIEASTVTPYFQIGESKYGKPIIDRVLTPLSPLDEVAKCALVSMDSTLRSNVSVGLPLDLLVYERDTLRVSKFALLDNENEYFRMIHSTWGERLRQVFAEIPDPVWSGPAHAPVMEGKIPYEPPRGRLPLGMSASYDDTVQTLAQAFESPRN